MIPVSHHGLHWADGGIAFLHQDEMVTNALGLPIPSPFEVRLPAGRRASCNHRIQLPAEAPHPLHAEQLELLRKDPLFAALLPLPPVTGGIIRVNAESVRLRPYLSCLSRLTSPIYRTMVQPFWLTTMARVLSELTVTNLQPLVLTDIGGIHQQTLTMILQAAPMFPRPLILVSSSFLILPPEVQQIETGMLDVDLEDLIQLPLEQLGAWTLKQHMVKE